MTQYDHVAPVYHNVLENPYYPKIILPSVVKMLGDIKGKDVLDLACGDGTQTQKLQKLGAKKVVGVDISQGITSICFSLERDRLERSQIIS